MSTADAAAAMQCTLRVCVHGRLDAAMDAYSRATDTPHTHDDEVTYCASSSLSTTTHKRVQLGFVAAASQLGAWGNTAPLLLLPHNTTTTTQPLQHDNEDGDVTYSSAAVTLPVSALSLSSRTLECRLVLLSCANDDDDDKDERDDADTTRQSPPRRQRICAVDTAHTLPRVATLTPLQPSSSLCARANDSNNDDGSDEVTVCAQWRADVYVHTNSNDSCHGDDHNARNATTTTTTHAAATTSQTRPLPDVHFTSAHEQFAWLCAQQCTDGDDDDDDNNNNNNNNTTSLSTMLSLTFYLADPTVSFEREAWLRQLPAPLQRGMQCKLQQQQREVRHDDADYGVVRVAPRRDVSPSRWCVRPLRWARPVCGARLRTSWTQDCWHTIVHTRAFDTTHMRSSDNDDDSNDDALEVTLRVPIVVDATTSKSHGVCNNNDDDNKDASLRVRMATGTTVLTRAMLPCLARADARGANAPATSGTLRLPVCCTTTAAAVSDDVHSTTTTTVWVVLHVQYLLLRPFVPRNGSSSSNDDGVYAPLRLVRSRESDAHMVLDHVAGHRGLGRTYTRAPRHNQLCKLAENSIPAFCAAHRRGCAMIEFDVMRTRDRVPVVLHDPLLQVFASDCDVSSVNDDDDDNNDNSNVRQSGHVDAALPRRAHCHGGRDTTTTTTTSSCDGVGGGGTMPVVVAVHELTYRQLRSLAMHSYYFDQKPSLLKHLLLRHWHALVRHTPLPRLHDGSDVKKLHNSNNNDNNNNNNNNGNTTRLQLPRRQVDVMASPPTLRDVLARTPATLQLNLEVKYPFQPQWDANLFLQSAAFEVNAFVDDILDVVLAHAQPQRRIVFGSFDPDVCIALACKQSRYDVVFICDADELTDLKDYRCFHTEGALQFAQLHHLAGVSLRATSLCRPDQRDFPNTQPFTAFRTVNNSDNNNDSDNDALARWRDFDAAWGRDIVDGAHARQLRVWTWGDCNSDAHFVRAQQRAMHVDAVIADHVPVCERHTTAVRQ